MEENLIKEMQRLAVIIVVALLLITSYYAVMANIKSDRMDRKLDTIQNDLIERDHLDSLYHEHLKECSFISREEIKTDSRGYLYSQYHKYSGRK